MIIDDIVAPPSPHNHPPIEDTFGSVSSLVIVTAHVPSTNVALLDMLLRMTLNVSFGSYTGSSSVVSSSVTPVVPARIVAVHHVYV